MRVRKLAAAVLGLCLTATALWGCGKAERTTQAGHAADPLIWYNRSGLYACFPGENPQEIAGFDSTGETNAVQRFLGRHDPTQDVRFDETREQVYFCRNYREDTSYGFFSGELCARKFGGAVETVAADIVKYEPTAGGTLLAEDKTGALSLYRRTEKSWQGEVLAALVLDFRVSADRQSAVYLTGDGNLYALHLTESGEQRGAAVKLASGMQQINFASADLRQLYCSDAGGSLCYSADLHPVQVVSVDVDQSIFIRKTGHAYYLRDEHSVPEEQQQKKAVSDVKERGEELARRESEAVAEEPDAASAQQQTALSEITPAEGKTLCYFDGTKNQILLHNVSRLSAVYADRVQADRALAWQGSGSGFSIYLLRDSAALNTGLHLIDQGLLDLALDAGEDKFYYVLFRPDGEGEQDPQRGTVFARTYTAEEIEKEEALFSGVSGISNAQGGNVFAGAENPNESYASLVVDGQQLAERVASYQRISETGKALFYLKDVFPNGDDKGGTLVKWDGGADNSGEELFYGVSDYEAEEDGSAVLLTGYGDTKELWYYGADGTKQRLDEAAIAFRHRESE